MSELREVVFKVAVGHSDARGEIHNVFGEWIQRLTGVSLAAQHVAVVTSKAGSIRAEHWHPPESGEHQFMYLVSGRYTARCRPHGTKEPYSEQVMSPGNLAYCPPGVDHAYRFEEDSIFLNINTADRAPEKYAETTIPLTPEERLF